MQGEGLDAALTRTLTIKLSGPGDGPVSYDNG
jgi:hypothetical protein